MILQKWPISITYHDTKQWPILMKYHDTPKMTYFNDISWYSKNDRFYWHIMILQNDLCTWHTVGIEDSGVEGTWSCNGDCESGDGRVYVERKRPAEVSWLESIWRNLDNRDVIDLGTISKHQQWLHEPGFSNKLHHKIPSSKKKLWYCWWKINYFS